MNGERSVLRIITEFDPLPIAYVAGGIAVGVGVIDGSGLACFGGYTAIAFSELVRVTNFEDPEVPRKKNDDK
ncbi:MAG: hypothetical protein AAB512_04680 [Patescibacteria group bacterium]